MNTPEERRCRTCKKWCDQWCTLAVDWHVCGDCCPYREQHREPAR